MTTSLGSSLSWGEVKEARRIASQLVRIHRKKPGALSTEREKVLVATMIHMFKAQFLTPEEEQILNRE
jgi:hypothetical protein